METVGRQARAAYHSPCGDVPNLGAEMRACRVEGKVSHTHTHIHTYVRMHSHAYTLTHMYTLTCTHTNTQTLTHSHIYTCTNTQSHPLTCTHIHTHTNTPLDFPLLSLRIYWPTWQSSGVGCLPVGGGGCGELTQIVPAPSGAPHHQSPETWKAQGGGGWPGGLRILRWAAE